MRKPENEKQINIKVGDLKDLSSEDSEEDEKENASKRSKKSKAKQDSKQGSKTERKPVTSNKDFKER